MKIFFLLSLASPYVLTVDRRDPAMFLPLPPDILQKVGALPHDPFRHMAADVTRSSVSDPLLRAYCEHSDGRRCRQDGEERQRGTLRLLHAARVAHQSARTGPRRHFQSTNYSAPFALFRRHAKAAQVVRMVASKAAKAGFSAPAVVYAMFAEEAVAEAIPFDCWRVGMGRNGGVSVVCEDDGGAWVEANVVGDQEDELEAWALIGKRGRGCLVIRVHMQSERIEEFTTPFCVPCARYSPSF